MTSIQYVATLSPEDNSFLTQVTPAVRAAFVVLFDICLEVYPEETNLLLLRAVEAVLKDPRISVNKGYATRVRRMVYEFSLTYPSAFFKGTHLEELQGLIRTNGENLTVSRLGTCRSPWIRSLVENVFKQAMEGITPESRVLMLKDWIVLTREELTDNRQISDFKELAEIVLARFDHMELFKELLTTSSKKATIVVDPGKVEEAVTAMEVLPATPNKPFEEFFDSGVITTASPEHQIYPGYNINYERSGRTWGMYLDMVTGPHRVKLEVFEGELFLSMLTCTYRDHKTNRLIHDGGKLNFGGRELRESDMSSFVRVDEPATPPKEYLVRSCGLSVGNEYVVTVWKNFFGLGDTDRRFYLISFYGDAGPSRPNWSKIQEVTVGKYTATLWESPRFVAPTMS